MTDGIVSSGTTVRGGSGNVSIGSGRIVVVGYSTKGIVTNTVDWLVGKVGSTGETSLVVVVELVEEVVDVPLGTCGRVLVGIGGSVVVVVVVVVSVVGGFEVVVV